MDTAVVQIRGRTDALIPPRDGDVVVECGHFGCVTLDAFRRAADFQASLGFPILQETHVDAIAEIGALLAKESMRPEAEVQLMPPAH